MAYIRIPIETNPETLAQDVFNEIKANASEWVASDANLDVWIIRAMARKAAENRDLASDVSDDIFWYFGNSMVNVPPNGARSAVGTVTFTAIDTLGHTIDADTTLVIASGEDQMAFRTVTDAVIAPGGSTVGGVSIVAIEPGEASSGLVGPIELRDVLDYIDTVTLVGATTGGADPETYEEYLNRLKGRLSRLSTRPILPEDFAAMAPDAHVSVFRVVALDGYNPDDDTWDNEKMITLAAVDENGEGISTDAKNDVKAYLESNREQNFIVNVIDPNYTMIDVEANIVVSSGFDAVSIKAQVADEIERYLSPYRWGQDPTFTDVSIRQTWVDSPTVYMNELITLVSNILGVERVTSLRLAESGDPLLEADVDIAGPAGLTRPGTITVP